MRDNNQWTNSNVDKLKDLISQGLNLRQCGEEFGVSRQRIKQVINQFNLPSTYQPKPVKPPFTPQDNKTKKIARILATKKVLDSGKVARSLEKPDYCPMLGIKLNYEGEKANNRDAAASIDKIKPELGYVEGNMQVISYRANRIKNDATPEELYKIAIYMHGLQKKEESKINLYLVA